MTLIEHVLVMLCMDGKHVFVESNELVDALNHVPDRVDHRIYILHPTLIIGRAVHAVKSELRTR